jgi:hypothetical protein
MAMTLSPISHAPKEAIGLLLDSLPETTVRGLVRHRCQQVHQRVLSQHDIIPSDRLPFPLDPRRNVEFYRQFNHDWVQWVQLGIRTTRVRVVCKKSSEEMETAGRQVAASSIDLAVSKFDLGECIEKATALWSELPGSQLMRFCSDPGVITKVDHACVFRSLRGKGALDVTTTSARPPGLIADPFFKVTCVATQLQSEGGELLAYVKTHRLFKTMMANPEDVQQVCAQAQQIHQRAQQLLPTVQCDDVSDFRTMLWNILPMHVVPIEAALRSLLLCVDWQLTIDQMGDYTLSTPPSIPADQLEQLSSKLSSWRFTRHQRVRERGQLTAIGLKNQHPAVWVAFEKAIGSSRVPTVPLVMRSLIKECTIQAPGDKGP